MKSIFKLGEYQKLEAVKEVPMGMYLSLPDTMRRSDEAKELVLLPKREMPKDLQVNDLITVFIYKDSEDRPSNIIKTECYIRRICISSGSTDYRYRSIFKLGPLKGPVSSF